MKTILLCIGLLVSAILSAQSGNTINDAISIDGTNVNVNALDYDAATISGLTPACGSTEDVFYTHTPSVGDNKITVGITSASTTVIATIDYQVLVAVNGDLNQLQEVVCDNYDVVLVAGGSFQFVIENINTNDTYYLRVHKPSGLGATLTTLLNSSSITIVSQFDATLSSENKIQDSINLDVDESEILINNYNKPIGYQLYTINGKVISEIQSPKHLNSINVSTLNQGIYILKLFNQEINWAYKFYKP